MVPEAELVRRLGTRMICDDCGTNADRQRQPVADAVRKCGGQLVQRADDNDAVVRERLEGVPAADASRSSSTTATRPTFRSIDGAQPPDRVAADLAAAIEAAGKRRGGAGGRRGDRLPVGGRARADARGRPAGRRSADGAGGARWRRA